MSVKELPHSLSYRSEIVGPLFAHLRAGDSCAIVGAGSMGKSRLLQFIREERVQRHYLDEALELPLLAWADANRLQAISAWGLYELLITALVEACAEHAEAHPLLAEAAVIRDRAVNSRDELLACRALELLVPMVLTATKRTLVFLCDEFDQIYEEVSSLAFANLRALRDRFKFRVCFVLLVRNHPSQLRPPHECEGFYELISRAVLGLGPYGGEDARHVAEQIAQRRLIALGPEGAAVIAQLSGGHPGLIGALCDRAKEGLELSLGPAAGDERVREECRKLVLSLSEDERLAVHRLVDGDDGPPELDQLLLKGIVRAQGTERRIFSPLLAHYLASEHAPLAAALVINHATRAVQLGNRSITLTPLQYNLVALLAQNPGRIFSHEEIIDGVYHHNGDTAIDNNRLEGLVRQLRKRIEPTPHHPRHLVTVRGVGYKLLEVTVSASGATAARPQQDRDAYVDPKRPER